MSESPACVVDYVDHVGIAVYDLDKAIGFFHETFGAFWPAGLRGLGFARHFRGAWDRTGLCSPSFCKTHAFCHNPRLRLCRRAGNIYFIMN